MLWPVEGVRLLMIPTLFICVHMKLVNRSEIRTLATEVTGA